MVRGVERFFIVACFLVWSAAMVCIIGSPAAAEPPVTFREPGWIMPQAQAVAPEAAFEVLQRTQKSRRPGRVSRALPADEAEQTARITSLAKALDNDPLKILDYVYNNIEYTPSFGSTKTAETVLLSGRGNDCDQASLVIALLRASGYTANYGIGNILYDWNTLAHWIGTDASDGNTIMLAYAEAGIPIGDATDQGAALIRVWADVTIDGTAYPFDPAVKTFQSDGTGFDPTSAMGYDRDSFTNDSESGALSGAYYTRDINETKIIEDLDTYGSALISHIQSNLAPDATLADVLGGRSVAPQTSSAYPTAMPGALGIGTVQVYQSVPDQYRHTVRLQHAGIDETFYSFQLGGTRVTMFYPPTSTAPELRVNGELQATGENTVNAMYYGFTVSIDHPYAAYDNTYGDDSYEFVLKSGGAYALALDCNTASEKLIQVRNKILGENLTKGLDFDSEAVLGEGLHLVGLYYYYQLLMNGKIVDAVSDTIGSVHHMVGIIGQDRSYFMDMAMNFTSRSAVTAGVDTLWPRRTSSMLSSAFEHAAFEQLQRGNPEAVSTIKLLDKNNSDGGKTFMADAANWGSVQTQLKNYSATILGAVESGINAGQSYILPEYGAMTLNDWQGTGYISYSGGSMGMMISGAISGGQGTGETNLCGDGVGDALDDTVPDADKEEDTPEGGDPVDMAVGGFHYERRDLSLSAGKYDLDFKRFYNSADSAQDGPLGNGWRHNYQFALKFHSDGPACLVGRNPEEAAGLIAYNFIILDVLKSEQTAQSWTTAAVMSKWAADEMIDNAITVRTGKKSYKYIQTVDGNYSPPPGFTRGFKRSGSHYYLQGDTDYCLIFNSAGEFIRMTDTAGNDIFLTYDGSGRLSKIASEFGPTLNLAYTANHINAITASDGRKLSYTYTGNDLASFRDPDNNQWTYTYDSKHRLSSLTQPQGNTIITNTYDEYGRVTSQTDANGFLLRCYFGDKANVMEYPDGSRETYYLDEDGRMIGQKGRDGKELYYQYDTRGLAKMTVDTEDKSTQYTYDPQSGEIASITNPLGNTVEYNYTPVTISYAAIDGGTVDFTEYFLTRVDYPDNSRSIYIYDDSGQLTQYRNRNNRTTQYEYNSAGQITKETNPVGGETTYTYDASGRITKSVDSDGVEVQYQYDLSGRVSRILNKDGTFMQLTYDGNDRLVSSKDENDLSTNLTYDGNGNLINLKRADGRIVAYEYDLMNRLTKYTNPAGKSSNFGYDSMGRISTLTNPNGVTVTKSYNNKDLVSAITDGEGKVWTQNYNNEGILVSAGTPMGRTSATSLNDNHWPVGSVDPLGNQGSINFDAMGNAVSMTDREGRTTTYEHDKNGGITQVGRPIIGNAKIKRNALGNILTVTDFNGSNWSFGYTKMGRMNTFTDPLGSAWGYTYNDRGRLSGITYPDGTAMTAAFDPTGREISRQYDDVTLTYEYNAMGSATSSNDVGVGYDELNRVNNTIIAGESFRATYDNTGRLATTTYNSGQYTVTYGYDNRNLVTSISDNLGNWVGFSYNDDMELSSMTRSNNITTVYERDGCGRVTSILEQGTAGNLAEQYFTRNKEGEVTQASTNLPLDPADYLSGLPASFDYNAASQVSSSGYSYDLRGRLIAARGKALGWDGPGRVTSLAGATLGYNGFGDLISKTENSVTTTYYYNYAVGMNPVVAEKDGSTRQFKRFYVYTPKGAMVFMIDVAAGNAARFPHFDRMGTVLFLTDWSGHITDSYAYSPYGRLLTQSGSSDQVLTFGGRFGVMRLSDGFYLMRKRVFDAVAGRFVSRDPLGTNVNDPGSINPYQYAYQDPVNGIDPWGTMTWNEDKTIGYGKSGMYVQTDPPGPGYLGGWKYVPYPPEENKVQPQPAPNSAEEKKKPPKNPPPPQNVEKPKAVNKEPAKTATGNDPVADVPPATPVADPPTADNTETNSWGDLAGSLWDYGSSLAGGMGDWWNNYQQQITNSGQGSASSVSETGANDKWSIPENFRFDTTADPDNPATDALLGSTSKAAGMLGTAKQGLEMTAAGTKTYVNLKQHSRMEKNEVGFDRFGHMKSWDSWNNWSNSKWNTFWE